MLWGRRSYLNSRKDYHTLSTFPKYSQDTRINFLIALWHSQGGNLLERENKLKISRQTEKQRSHTSLWPGLGQGWFPSNPAGLCQFCLRGHWLAGTGTFSDSLSERGIPFKIKVLSSEEAKSHRRLYLNKGASPPQSAHSWWCSKPDISEVEKAGDSWRMSLSNRWNRLLALEPVLGLSSWKNLVNILCL